MKTIWYIPPLGMKLAVWPPLILPNQRIRVSKLKYSHQCKKLNYLNWDTGWDLQNQNHQKLYVSGHHSEIRLTLHQIYSDSLREETPLPHSPWRLWRFASHLHYAQVLCGCPAGSVAHPFLCWILDPPLVLSVPSELSIHSRCAQGKQSEHRPV